MKKAFGMTTIELRNELHQYIDSADARILQLIYGMVQADSTEKKFELSEMHRQVLDERLEAHVSNPGAGSDWKELKVRISSQL